MGSNGNRKTNTRFIRAGPNWKMNKLAWIFGNTSNFSQAIRFELESQNISTYGFGRDNTDYNDFDSFISLGPGAMAISYLLLYLALSCEIRME